ncbi:MAG: hypothetical protein M9894_39800 [Planctomycetes bacterium]|nr:hypothetical protein [Planctomycetota bacterium]
MSNQRLARGAGIFLLLLLLAGCAAAPPERVREGEALLARGDWAGAARAFDEALRDGRATALDRRRAQVGEARAFLLKGDLVGARTRLRRLDEDVSDRWYLLGTIALREGDLAEAEACLRGALERAHGGDTAALLARVLAGEARAPDPLDAAAGVVEVRAAPLAEALRAAAAAWRDAVAGREPAALLERLAAIEDRVGGYPAVRVLRARLLDRAGRPDEAGPLWEHAGLSPTPSEGFRAWASDLRARLAMETGDAAALDLALAGADPVTAARVRADLARGRARRGDLRGALDAWRQAAGTSGAPASAVAEALAEAAWLEEVLGLPSSPDAWARAQQVALAAPGAARASPLASRPRATRSPARGWTRRGSGRPARSSPARSPPSSRGATTRRGGWRAPCASWTPAARRRGRSTRRARP